jgi:hypothetical protein
MRIIKNIHGKKDEYSVIITIRKGKIIDAICDCRFGSLYPNNFQEGKGICIHIKKVLKNNER